MGDTEASRGLHGSPADGDHHATHNPLKKLTYALHKLGSNDKPSANGHAQDGNAARRGSTPGSPGSPRTGSSTAVSNPISPRRSFDLPFRRSSSVDRRRGSIGFDPSTKGKAQARTERHRQEKEDKMEKAKAEREEIERRRHEEEEIARQLEDEETRARYGDLVEPAELVSLRDIQQGDQTVAIQGKEITIRVRIHTQRKVSAALDFLLLRDQTDTIQGVLHRNEGSKHMVKWVQRLHPESIVQVRGKLSQPSEPIHSASIHNLEIQIEAIHLVRPAEDVPFDLYHHDEPTHNRLQHRIVDLRHPSNQAVFRIRAKIMQTFRASLDAKNFMEISTPKLQPAATESGASVFKVKYFGRTAFLAQSPQLAKQMAISADFGKVYEVGPVFRAENSNTHRHLTEYTGLDIEMAIEKHYHELLHVLTNMLKNVFTEVYKMRTEIDRVKERWPSEDLVWLDETPIIPFPEGIQMLRDDGREVEMEDLSTRDEIRLGELVKEKYKTDFYVLDKFPKNARPFYTMTDGDFTNSFDMFIRGQEICTGGQRINDAAKLRAAMKEAGIEEDTMTEYLSGFDYGIPPHGGAGLGLERVVFLMLNLGNVRFASLFHRDPKSLPAKPLTLTHPESTTLKTYTKDNMPPVEELIANYGDATNTSWLDDRFEIWRHPSNGAAIGYVKQKKFAMVAGDPLCEKSQYPDVIMEFLRFVYDELKLTPIWMLVSDPIQELLAKKLRWRTLTCTEEQRVDTDKLRPTKDDGQNQRRLEREGISLSEQKPTPDLTERVNKRIDEWKAQRSNKGKQVHLTEIQPWRDTAHRRYFIAENKQRVVQSMVVLAKLSPQHGWQVKWALDFPNSVNGSIEVLVGHALNSISGPVTFGAGVSEKLVPGSHLHGIKAKFLSNTYSAVTSSLKLRNKAEFREKFGTVGEPVWICYPKHGVGPTDLNEIVKFFED